MEQTTVKQKSFYYQFKWAGVILLGMGLLFGIIGGLIQVMPLTASNFHSTVNGVRQPFSEENVRVFRLAFLFGLGGAGLIQAVVGGVIIGRGKQQQRLSQRLKEEGVRLRAQVVECTYANVRVNHQPAMKLVCSHGTSNGRHYLFTSRMLRRDPRPYLTDDQVTVYYDRDHPKRYFVDVDGSVGEVYEL